MAKKPHKTVGLSEYIANPMRRHETRNGFLFVLPWIIGFLAFTAYPLISSLYYSFCDYNVIKAPKLVGLKNYIMMFDGSDEIFLTACKNILYMIGIGVPITTIYSILVSVLLNNRYLRGTSWMRVIFFIPTLVPTVVGSLLWIWVMQPDTGVVNTILGYFGITGPGWFSDPAWAKGGFILFMIWTCGNAVMIYISGLQGVSESLYDAASIDGAGFWKSTWHITLPMLRPTILYNLVTLIIAVFQWFAEPYIMTEGGPSNATMFYALYLYQNAFQYFKMGYASAQGWVMLIICLIIIMILFKLMNFSDSEMDS